MAITTITTTGHLGKAATQRTTQAGKTVTTFPIAATSRSKVNGEWVDGETLWFTVSVWGALSEMQFDKGTHVLVTGELVKKTYKKDDGSDYESLFINATSVAIVPSRINVPTSDTAAAVASAPEQSNPWATSSPLDIETPF